MYVQLDHVAVKVRNDILRLISMFYKKNLYS